MRRRLLPTLVAIVGACLVALLVYGVSAQSANRSLDQQLAEGKHPTAPDAARPLPVLLGAGKGSLAALHGRVVVLNFWASWCTPCLSEAPLLERAQAALTQHEGTVLGVTYLDLSTNAQSFVRTNHLTYPSLRDTTGGFAHAYGTDQLPETFIVDRRGRIVAIRRGEIDQPFLDRALALAQQRT
jgi:cytochrome c biogenesis protein CcmG/thiol:disulfide interchange protein DsbE